MTSAVTHFEIYGNDLNKLAEFYRELFGWKIEKEPELTTSRFRLALPRRRYSGRTAQSPHTGPSQLGPLRLGGFDRQDD